jgi:MraZ protein
MYALIQKLDPLSEEYDHLTTAILGASTQLSFDKEEGRVVIPKNLIQDIQIDENVIFVGKGETFEIWNPEIFDEYFKKSREMAFKNRNVLKINNS